MMQITLHTGPWTKQWQVELIKKFFTSNRDTRHCLEHILDKSSRNIFYPSLTCYFFVKLDPGRPQGSQREPYQNPRLLFLYPLHVHYSSTRLEISSSAFTIYTWLLSVAFAATSKSRDSVADPRGSAREILDSPLIALLPILNVVEIYLSLGFQFENNLLHNYPILCGATIFLTKIIPLIVDCLWRKKWVVRSFVK